MYLKAKNPTLLFITLLFTTLCSAQAQPVQATAPISKYIYGQFLEHIGGIVNNNIWAEMLDGRKFYYPITSQPPAGRHERFETGVIASLAWSPDGNHLALVRSRETSDAMLISNFAGNEK